MKALGHLAVLSTAAFLLFLGIGVGGCGVWRCPQRNTPCVVTHLPTGCIWYLGAPPVGHRQNPTIGFPDQWASGYYHFASAGTAQDRKFGDVMRSPGFVSVPIHEASVVFVEGWDQ